MPILGVVASSKFTAVSNYESIQTVTVTSNQSSVSFTSIPSTYRHLQIRYSALTNRTTYAFDTMTMRVNGDSGSNYSYHLLRGRGEGTTEASGGTDNQWYLDWGFGTTVTNGPASGVFDILDYANTNKVKIMRGLYGVDKNGFVAGYAGAITLVSGGYYVSGNAAITSIAFTSYNGFLIAPGSSFALYGIKE